MQDHILVKKERKSLGWLKSEGLGHVAGLESLLFVDRPCPAAAMIQQPPCGLSLPGICPISGRHSLLLMLGVH
jgi:hypothetical protein